MNAEQLRFEILRIMLAHWESERFITLSQISERLPDEDKRSITRMLGTLKIAGVLQKTGSRRDSAWRLTGVGYELANSVVFPA